MKKLLLITGLAVTSAAIYAKPVSLSACPQSDDLEMIDAAGTVKAPEKETANSINFSFADTPQGFYSLNSITSGRVYLQVRFPVELQEYYKGAKITAINIYGATNSSNTNGMNKVKLYVNDDLTQVPQETTAVVLSTTGKAYNECPLDNPYTITGEKDIYIGYIMSFVSGNYYLPVDKDLCNPDDGYCMVGSAASSKAVPAFEDMGDQIGHLCMSFTIEGEALPENLVQMLGMEMDEYIPSGLLSYKVTMANYGANTINSIEIESASSNGTTYVRTYTLPTALQPSKRLTQQVINIPNDVEGAYFMTSTVKKINGAALEKPFAISTTYASYQSGYPRNLVVEEGTGTWCQWCPGGIVMMDYIKEKYPERWIRIAVHGGDEMQINGYKSFLSQYIPAFPGAYANRMYELPPNASGIYPYIDEVYSYYTSYPAYAEIDLDAECNDNGSSVSITSKTKFATNSNIPHNMIYVVTEDNVGPYRQSNAFSGGAYGSMGGWEDKPDPSLTYYDDVARAINASFGEPSGIPVSFSKDEESVNTTSLSLGNVTGDGFKVIAMMVNTVSNEIINAKEISVSKSGVKEIGMESENDIRIENGSVVSDKSVSVFTLDGRQVPPTGLRKGLYIILSNGKASKVMVD